MSLDWLRRFARRETNPTTWRKHLFYGEPLQSTKIAIEHGIHAYFCDLPMIYPWKMVSSIDLPSLQSVVTFFKGRVSQVGDPNPFLPTNPRLPTPLKTLKINRANSCPSPSPLVAKRSVGDRSVLSGEHRHGGWIPWTGPWDWQGLINHGKSTSPSSLGSLRVTPLCSGLCWCAKGCKFLQSQNHVTPPFSQIKHFIKEGTFSFFWMVQ